MALGKLESVRALREASARDERRPQLLDEERQAVRSIEHGGGKSWRRGRPQDG